MRVLFIGSQTIGYRCLKELIGQGDQIVGVVTFKPEAHESWAHSVDELAQQHGLPLKYPQTMNDSEFVSWAQQLKPDVIFVIGWRRIIPREIFSLPKMGTLAFHASLLPQLRGFSPINWAILLNHSHTGVTAFYMDDGVDTGDILAQVKIPIGPDDDVALLRQKIEDASVQIIRQYAPLIRSGKAPRLQQDHSKATYACARSPQDGQIDWKQGAQSIYNLIRSLAFPYPGAFTYCGGKKLIIWKASRQPSAMPIFGVAGQVASIQKGQNVFIVTGDGAICIDEVQEEGGSRMNAGDYFKSIRTKLGRDLEKEVSDINASMAASGSKAEK